MTSSAITRPLLAAAIIASGPASASDNPGAHQHGHAELQLAIAANQIELIFTSPAHNLLGFEHRARTEQQTSRVVETTGWLETTPLANSHKAGCAVVDAVVHYSAGGDNHDHNHDHSHGHGHGNEHEPSHSDFEVTQTLSCSNLSAPGTLTTPLTERFPGVEHLSVQWVWSGSQGPDRLNHGEASFGPHSGR